MTVRKCAQTSLAEKANTVAWIALLPFYVVLNLITGIASSKPWTRICTEKLSRFCTDHLQYNQIQWLQPDSVRIFRRWVQWNRVESTVEELPSGAKLLWLGPKRVDRVILCIHGGGFMFPLSEFAISFWHYICAQLAAKDVPVGMVFLVYHLYPEGQHPAQLLQARDALSYLLKSGVEPKNLQLAGESAGGNILLQLISHILHPFPRPSVAPIPVPRLAGVFLMSPWVWLGEDGGHDDRRDIISSRSLHTWGTLYLADVSEEEMPYVEALLAPLGWFDGLGNIAPRILMASGAKEGMVDAHIRFRDVLLKQEGVDFTFLVDEDGLHDSLMYDFSLRFLEMLQKRRIRKETGVLIDWLADGFR